MKTMKLIFGFAAMIFFTSQSFAQTPQHEAKEVRKEVNVEVENGETVLTITTTSDGTEDVEVYKGAEAEAKLEEMKKMQSGTTKTMVVGKDGQKHMKVEKRVVVTEEIEEEDE